MKKIALILISVGSMVLSINVVEGMQTSRTDTTESNLYNFRTFEHDKVLSTPPTLYGKKQLEADITHAIKTTIFKLDMHAKWTINFEHLPDYLVIKIIFKKQSLQDKSKIFIDHVLKDMDELESTLNKYSISANISVASKFVTSKD